MSEWIEYEGTDEQIEEMRNSEHGFIYRDAHFEECIDVRYFAEFMGRHHLKKYLGECEVTHYLICEEHHLADMIERWARTGQPVYWQNKLNPRISGICWVNQEGHVMDHPPFVAPNKCNYSFTPSEEEK